MGLSRRAYAALCGVQTRAVRKAIAQLLQSEANHDDPTKNNHRNSD
jgi:hypothetical protein